MLSKSLFLLAGSLAAIRAFTIPADQPDGIYAVLPDEDGSLTNRVQLSSWPSTDLTLVAPTGTASAKLARQAPSVVCGTNKALNADDYAAATADLDKLCSGGASIPAHQSFYSKHGTLVTFLCSTGAGGAPPAGVAGSHCSGLITDKCGKNNAGWVTISQVNVTYGVDLSTATLCGK